MRKETVLEAVNLLPPEFTLEELIERLILLQKIERGLKESAEGKGLSSIEARNAVRKWSK